MRIRSQLQPFAKLGLLATVFSVVAVGLPVMSSPLRVEPRIRHERIALSALRQLDAATWATSPTRASIPFSMMGVTFRLSAGQEPPDIEARTSTDGRRWSGWQELEVELDEGPDIQSHEYGVVATEPLWSPGSRYVQLRWSGHRQPPSMPRLHLIDPGPDPGPMAPAARAGAMTTQPPITTRAQWGADESIRRGSPRYSDRIRLAVVHHTATSNDYGPGDSAAIVRSIYAYHVHTNGWDDLGYNFLVDRYGRIFEGRAGGIDRAVIGAHSRGFNTVATGAAVIGTFSGAAVPQPATDAMTSLLAWKLDVHHIDPQGRTTVRSAGSNRHPEGAQVTLDTVSGHRDVVNTDCPGNVLYSAIAGMRSAAAGIGLPKIFDPEADPAAINRSHPNPPPARVTARLAGASRWAAQVLNAQGVLLRSHEFQGTNVSFAFDGRDAAGAPLGPGQYTVRLHAAAANNAPARPADVPVVITGWPDGTVLRPADRGTVYRVAGSQLRPFASAAEFLSTYRFAEVAEVPAAVVDGYSIGSWSGFRNGSLIRTPNGAVWIVSAGQRRSFNSAADFNRLRYNWDAVVNVSDQAASVHQVAGTVSPAAHPDGTLLRGSGAAVFWLQDGRRRPIPSAAVFETWFRWHEIVQIPDAQLALRPVGDQLTFRDGTLIRVPNNSTVWVISNGRKRPISSAATFVALGYKWENVRQVSPSEAATAPNGPVV